MNNAGLLEEQQPATLNRNKILKHIAAISMGTLLGIPLMLVGFIQLQGAVFTRASDSAPRDVVISEVTDTSATLHWTTDQLTQGTILYGTSPTELRLTAPEYEKSGDHTVTINLLAPDTTYYFQIKIGEEIFINGSELWTFKTRPVGYQNITPTPEKLPGNANSSCPVTDDCSIIQKELGKSCTSVEYVQCLKRKQ